MELWTLILSSIQQFKRQNFWQISHTRQALIDNITPTDLITNTDHHPNKAVGLNHKQVKTFLVPTQSQLQKSQVLYQAEKVKAHQWVQRREAKEESKKTWKMRFLKTVISTVKTLLQLFRIPICFLQTDRFTKKFQSLSSNMSTPTHMNDLSLKKNSHRQSLSKGSLANLMFRHIRWKNFLILSQLLTRMLFNSNKIPETLNFQL